MKMNIKIILLGLGILLAGEIIWAVFALSPLRQEGNLETGVQNGQTVVDAVAIGKTVVSLETDLSPQAGSVKVGDKFSVSINIASQKPTDGADIILLYDPKLLSVVKNGSDDPPVITGSLYSDYPLNSVDERSGKISVSGITSSAGGLTPKGTFGTVAFQAKSAGKAEIYLEFKLGSTVDTNVIESKTAKDILDEVSGLSLEIKP